MATEVEVKKVDSQGRLILPSEWRASQLSGTSEVYVIRRNGYLKIVPKRRPNLAKFFDKVDLVLDAIGDWNEFEKAQAEKAKK